MTYKLLLADDSVTIQRVIELTFADEDIEVVAVGDGQQAIERIRADAPDIVLADVDMPERNGFEVAEFVKRTPEYDDIPVVLLTGAFEPVDDSRVAAIGCDGVLAKPFEPQLLIARVKQLLAARNKARVDEQSRLASAVEREHPATDLAAPPQGEQAIPPTSVSLDEYFERLDLAFSSLNASSSPASPSTWTPAPSQAAGSVEGNEASSEEGAPAPAADSYSADEPASAQTKNGQPGRMPTSTLAAACSALLAAEQGRPLPPGAIFVLPAAVLPLDAIVEEVTRRVVAGLASQEVRDQVATLVADIAERLVREEIERIKASVT